MNKHTQTPWYFQVVDGVPMVTDGNDAVAVRTHCYARDDNNDLKHIVKCVNIVAELEQKGITVEQLEKLISGDAWIAEWQPIETAPKNGKEILVSDEYEDMAVLYYAHGRWEAFTMYTDSEYHSVYCDIEPTRWTPLPELPKGE